MSKIALLTAPGKIKLKDRDSLKPGPCEVVIATEHTGICGTDLSLYSGDYSVPLPLVPGHEFVGIVSEVGPGVDADWKGRRVTAEINNSCVAYEMGTLCSACKRSIPSHCLNRTVTGIVSHSGAFAQELTVPVGALHEIPEDLDPLAAVLTEPFAAALQTFVMSPMRGNETVVVLGPGRLGILIVFAAAINGLRVFAVSRSQHKRERALRYGAENAFHPEAAENEIKDLTEGLGADMVVDATGHSDGIGLALSLVRPRGVIAAKTTCGLPAQGLDMTRLVVEEVRIQGSRCGPFDQSLEILSHHQEELKRLITSVRPLSEIVNALESALTEDKIVLKTN